MKIVTVKDKFQKNYKYELSESAGKSFDSEFKPELTPKQMLELGIYGGVYFNGDGEKEFPKDWFKKYKKSESGEYEKNLNFYNVRASKPLKYWREKGWIYKDDPRGWIQWYFRYYYGRRIPKEDQRQIKRWKALTRHIAQLSKNCDSQDLNCRPVQRQAILHWAYDSRRM